jgi:hypothetical protein
MKIGPRDWSGTLLLETSMRVGNGQRHDANVTALSCLMEDKNLRRIRAVCSHFLIEVVWIAPRYARSANVKEGNDGHRHNAAVTGVQCV